jgi:DNA-binding MarR family transcriptional regulator
MKEQPSYYAILTADVRYSKVLKPNEKLLFAEITALTNMNGQCFATNKYFAELYDVSVETVSRWVTHLEKQGFINRTIKYKDKSKQIDKRFISLATPIDEKINTPHDKKVKTPIDEKVKGNSTSFNSSFNKGWEVLIDNFYPNSNSLDVIKEEYGGISDKVLHAAIQEFKDKAGLREKPFLTERAINSGFNNYVRGDEKRGWLQTLEKTKAKPQTHAQMSKQINQRMDGKVIPAPKSMKEIEDMLNQNNKRRLQHG